MRSAFAPLLVVASFAGVALSQLTIITPSAPVECQPTLITWSGGTPPYFLTCVTFVNDADDQATILVNFGTLSNNSLTWTINQPAGTNCQLFIKDSTGAPQNSAPFSVSAGSTSCLGGGSSSGGSAPSSSGSVGASAPASSSKASSTPPVSTPATSTPATSTPVSTPGASTTPASASSTKPASSAASVSGSSPSASPTNAALGSSVPAAAAAAALGVVFAALF
ncbi:hypothetical protein C8R47DRAFT_1327628 [Mycena vitilis]|nr:hypothetical protein C8R47DRAFT_1327628 [Mycena vitilis]